MLFLQNWLLLLLFMLFETDNTETEIHNDADNFHISDCEDVLEGEWDTFVQNYRDSIHPLNSAVDENDVQKKPDTVPQSSSLLLPYNESNPSNTSHIFNTSMKEDVFLVGLKNSNPDVFIVTSENSIETINNGGTSMYVTITSPLRYPSTVSTCTLCLLLIR